MTQDAFEIQIDDLGAQGDGIAHQKQTTLFVPGTLPGEHVRLRASADICRPALIEILAPSPDRVVPPCPHFGVCGGCRLQHMKTEAMTAWKEQQIKRLIEQNGLRVHRTLPTFATPAASRRRARLTARHSKDGILLGFNAEKSHRIVPIDVCPLLHPRLEAFLSSLRTALPSWLPRGEACDIQLTLLPGGIDMLLIGGPALDLEARLALAMLADTLDVAQLSWRKLDRSRTEPVAFRVPLSVTFGRTQVAFPPGSFLQVSQEGEEALLAFAKAAAPNAESVMDLFCGLGGFGLSMPKARRHLFIDNDGPAIDALARAIKGRDKDQTDRLNLMRASPSAFTCNAYDLVIFDPPRGGARAVAERLAESCVPDIVAISCDPPSFMRDAKLLQDGGYQCQTLQIVDQFLWSAHCEVAAHFKRG